MYKNIQCITALASDGMIANITSYLKVWFSISIVYPYLIRSLQPYLFRRGFIGTIQNFNFTYTKVQASFLTCPETVGRPSIKVLTFFT